MQSHAQEPFSENTPFPAPVPVASMVEGVVGCKWALGILTQIRNGICRPGAIQRAIEGLSTKVLNERLHKMTRFGILERVDFQESPPHVEYQLTGFGRGFLGILDQIAALQHQIEKGAFGSSFGREMGGTGG